MWRRRGERQQRARLIKGSAGAPDATVLYQRLLAVLEEKQIRKPVWFTPLEFAQKLPASELSAQIAEFTRAYNRLRYGNDARAASEMLAIYDRIRKS